MIIYPVLMVGELKTLAKLGTLPLRPNELDAVGTQAGVNVTANGIL